MNFVILVIIFNLGDPFFEKSLAKFYIYSFKQFKKKYLLNQRLRQNKHISVKDFFNYYIPFCVRNVFKFQCELINHFKLREMHKS